MKRQIVAGLGLALAIAASGVQADEPVVSVNGDVLTQTQFDQAVNQRTRGQGGQLPEGRKQAFLQQLVDLEILAQKAAERGVGDDPAVQAELANTRRAILARGLIERIAKEDIDEDAIKAAYKKQYADKAKGKEYKASHILVKDEKTAKEVIGKLDDGGDFADLAKEYSTGPTGKRGGDLGWFGPNQMVPAFSKAVQALEPGNYTSEPVKTQFGWHVIRLSDVRQAKAPKLAEVRDQIKQTLARQEIRSRLDEWRKDAEVDYQADWARQDGNGSK
ncbi:putative parvulin-type peptidyl-prolyl cis-trans isomerase [wastewater metagenome]|uniref:Putative parvulin-type peptidyl-prolyl cis-trans isomerase n=4 Tax=root TaxID=1 RepID=A0A5B8RCU3_9ZZZZ|nr:peptidylprolyl isomerase [Arhodomonas aquaeolei]MCS4505015.1 peptidylprolyl isomerase [Arhodomonas aquaeolei]QEA05242.1 putative parvulin-type peptidyl-prolyl cis-trans isomerase [uncultured organism]